MTRFVSLVLSASALATLAAGCQQPLRCGALNEYCCVDEFGGGFCLPESETGLRLQCNALADICEPDGSAPPCGGAGQQCCGGGTCTGGGLSCVANVCMSTTPGCGALGQTCCAGSACNTGDLRCDANVCVATTPTCGALGQSCCAGSVCNAGDLRCSDGMCVRATSGTSCPGTTGECDIGLEDCGSGQACALSLEGTTMCRAVGTGRDQSPCTDDTQCAIGHYCSPFSGRCHAQCCGDAGCTSSQTCIRASTASDAGLCFGSPCDPVDRTGCASAAACYVAGNPAGGILTICLPPGSGGAGSACAAIDDCAPGLVCLGDPGACEELCHPSSGFCSVGTCSTIDAASDLGVCQ